MNASYGILNATYTYIACYRFSTASSKVCELEVQVMRNIEAGIIKLIKIK